MGGPAKLVSGSLMCCTQKIFREVGGSTHPDCSTPLCCSSKTELYQAMLVSATACFKGLNPNAYPSVKRWQELLWYIGYHTKFKLLNAVGCTWRAYCHAVVVLNDEGHICQPHVSLCQTGRIYRFSDPASICIPQWWGNQGYNRPPKRACIAHCYSSHSQLLESGFVLWREKLQYNHIIVTKGRKETPTQSIMMTRYC